LTEKNLKNLKAGIGIGTDASCPSPYAYMDMHTFKQQIQITSDHLKPAEAHI